MTTLRSWIAAALIAATGGLIVVVAATTRAQPPKIGVVNAENLRGALKVKPTLVGTHSCTAQGCHGGLTRKPNSPIRGNEYASWLKADPHAEAYSDLFQDRSKRMAALLNLTEGAHRSERCLTCHSAGLPSHDAATAYAASDGVSCEACHGAASNWVDAHTSPTWKNMSADFQRTRHGLNPLKSLSARAKKCAECHVGTGDHNGDGSPDRDMNHDLIAAGHPRLNFEFSAYLANLPKHWDERTWDANGRMQKADPPADFETRAWAIGQVAVARAALDLLAARATAAVGSKPHAVWPELSEYGCFDCHHDLQPPSWRQAGYADLLAGDPARRLGQPAWGSWHYPLLSLLAKSPLVEQPPELDPFTKLRGMMSEVVIEPTRVSLAAHEAIAALDAWLVTLEAASYDPAATRDLLKHFSGDSAQAALTNWDSAAQLYLALVAVRSSRPADAALDEPLQQMAEALRFQPRASTSGDSLPLDSPDHFDPQTATLRSLQRFHQAVRAPAN